MNKSRNKVYLEWLFPIADYIDCLRHSERLFEQLIPFICSLLSTAICILNKASTQAFSHLNNLLPNVLSILIGFTISAISIIASTGNNLEEMINKKMNRAIGNKKITFKQWFLINLIYYLILEIFFLLLTFAVPLLHKIVDNVWITYVSIFLYVYLLMRILFGTIKVSTKLYQVFYKGCENKI